MTSDWQDIFALMIVASAVVYVASLVYRRIRRPVAGACAGGCFGCVQPAPAAAQLVTSIGTSDSVGQRVAVELSS